MALRLSCIVLLIGIALASVLAQEELYPDLYDDIDFVDNLRHSELEQHYFNCFMDVGPCNADRLKFVKEILPEALQTQCRKCTEKQKECLRYTTEWYITNKPDEWIALITKILRDSAKEDAE